VFVSVTSQFWPLASSDEQGTLAREHRPSSIRVVSLSLPYLLQRFFLGLLPNTASSGTPTRFHGHDEFPVVSAWTMPPKSSGMDVRIAPSGGGPDQDHGLWMLYQPMTLLTPTTASSSMTAGEDFSKLTVAASPLNLLHNIG
jgi:hypothetical protein